MGARTAQSGDCNTGHSSRRRATALEKKAVSSRLTCLLGFSPITPSRSRFKVVQSREWVVDNAIARIAHPHAIVNIVECNFQIQSIEPTVQFLRYRTRRRRETCAGHCCSTAQQVACGPKVSARTPVSAETPDRAPGPQPSNPPKAPPTGHQCWDR